MRELLPAQTTVKVWQCGQRWFQKDSSVVGRPTMTSASRDCEIPLSLRVSARQRFKLALAYFSSCAVEFFAATSAALGFGAVAKW
jgi:hypothetical protein